ncbi:unnamed protein product, partial [Effrenium voratum]
LMPTLTYLDVKGLGEPIRLTLFVGNVPFEDKRVSYEEVAELNNKGKLPFGQVPVLELDGETYAQSGALLRWAGRQAGLYPEEPELQLRCEAVEEALTDMKKVLVPVWYGSILGRNPITKEQLVTLPEETIQQVIKNLNEIVLPARFGQLEQFLATRPYFCGERMSICDISFYVYASGLMEGTYAKGIRPEVLDQCPGLKGLVDRISNHPRLRQIQELSAGEATEAMADSKLEHFAITRNKIVVAGLSSLVLGVTAVLDLLRRKSRPKGQPLPVPPGWWPIVGHFATCMRYCWENSNLAFTKWGLDLQRRKGMKIFECSFVGSRIVLVQDADLVQEIFTNDPERFTKDFSDAPLGGDLLEHSFRDGLFTAATDDVKWQVAHRVLIQPFSVRGVRGVMPLMCEQADQLMKAMKRDVGYGGTTYIDTWVTKMAFETIAVCGLGVSFGCFEDDKTHPFVQALNEVIQCFDPVGRWPVFLRPIFVREKLRKYMDGSRYLREYCVDIIKKRRQEGQQEKKDLIDRMLFDVDAKTGKKMSEESIVDNLLTFLLAGQDSTAAAMASCLCYLCDNPECKEKLLREIDEVVGQGEVAWEHLGKLQYLDWCIKETLRLMPPAAATIRQSTKDQLLGSFFVPKKVTVLVNMVALHYDTDLWGKDADSFKPERWEKGQPHKFAYLPFAFGPRACIGREFTLMEQKVTMVKLFQNFDVEPVPTEKVEGYTTLKANDSLPPFLGFPTQAKKDSAFVGVYSNFKLLPRAQAA